MKQLIRGFTLAEVMIVLAIISLLSATIYVNFSDARAQSRDIERKSDLRNLQAAIELYKQKYGRYPIGCPVTGEQWSGQVGTDYECDDGSNEYIRGHEAGAFFVGEFMPVLPTDPRLNGDESGYVYTTNTEGSVYIVKARRTVETENVDVGHEFQSCDRSNSGTAICDLLSTTNNGGSVPNHCQFNDVNVFDISYGVWGGLADEPFGWDIHPRAQELTEDVICMIP